MDFYGLLYKLFWELELWQIFKRCQQYNEMEIAPKKNTFLTVSPWEICLVLTPAEEHLEWASL